jgi:iron complex outermembrane receptor protein
VDNVQVIGNGADGPNFPPLIENGFQPVDIHTVSLFGQARWDIVNRLELAAGLRWTSETRDESPTLGGALVSVPVPSIHSDKDSPEVTLTWRPTDDLTTFAAWKEGFKSGSFSIATPVTPGTDNAFGDETVRGGELGLKSRWLDRQLTVNLAGYDYNYSGLQVGAISPPQNGVPVIQTLNAASARTYGVDFDAAYRPAAVEGLGIHSAVEWNHGRYLKFDNAPCWGGQLISEGCNQTTVAGPNTGQSVSGTPLVRAPEWQSTIGFDYELPMKGSYKLLFANSNEISSRYVTFLAVDRPNDDNYQGGFVKVDLSVTLSAPNNLWELAVIGKDLNDKITSGNCNNAPLLSEVVANPSGVASRSQTLGIDPVQCFADPGREVWVRLTVRPFAGHN